MRPGTRDNPIASFRVLQGKKLAGAHDASALRRTAVRWLKFNAVGALGIAVQLVVLLSLKGGLHLGYLPSTAIAVEAAAVHNFLWHERYTWADRVRPSWRTLLPRLLRFNLTTGGVSIGGNLALMRLTVGLWHVNYLTANGVAIVLCSLVNFLVSEEWVFEKERESESRNLRAKVKVALRPE